MVHLAFRHFNQAHGNDIEMSQLAQQRSRDCQRWCQPGKWMLFISHPNDPESIPSCQSRSIQVNSTNDPLRRDSPGNNQFRHVELPLSARALLERGDSELAMLY